MNVFASFQRELAIVDGAGYSGLFKFKGIWVGASGDIAISRDAGKTFTIFPSAAAGAVAGIASGEGTTVIGTTAEGTTAAGLVLGDWGPNS